MAKKQVAEKELQAKQAELQDTEKKVKEVYESEADSISIDEIKSKSKVADPNDFDWDADEKMFGNYSKADREKMEEMYSGTFNSVTKGEIISGTVVTINSKDVVLNIGFKSDGFTFGIFSINSPYNSFINFTNIAIILISLSTT